MLPQPSTACQVRVASKVGTQWPAVLVTVLKTITLTLPLSSVAVGTSKVHGWPSEIVLLVLFEQLITGAVVSTTFTVWLHSPLVFPQPSTARQVRVASKVLPQ